MANGNSKILTEEQEAASDVRKNRLRIMWVKFRKKLTASE